MLAHERNVAIEEWRRRVNAVPEFAVIPLSNAERTGHFPGLFDDLVNRCDLAVTS